MLWNHNICNVRIRQAMVGSLTNMTQQKLMTLPNLANLPLKSTTIAYKELTHSWLNSWTSTSKVNMPKHTERKILNFLEKFEKNPSPSRCGPTKAKK